MALGYLVGSGAASLAILGTVWWVERHHWWGLAARLVGGTALVLALAVLTRDIQGPTGVAAQLGAAVVFALVWLALTRRDVRALWSTLRGRGAPSTST